MHLERAAFAALWPISTRSIRPASRTALYSRPAPAERSADSAFPHSVQAVHTIHEARIVHSDLKPANFLVVEGQLKLIDFGIAKAISSDTTSIAREAQARATPPSTVLRKLSASSPGTACVDSWQGHLPVMWPKHMPVPAS